MLLPCRPNHLNRGLNYRSESDVPHAPKEEDGFIYGIYLGLVNAPCPQHDTIYKYRYRYRYILCCMHLSLSVRQQRNLKTTSCAVGTVTVEASLPSALGPVLDTCSVVAGREYCGNTHVSMYVWHVCMSCLYVSYLCYVFIYVMPLCVLFLLCLYAFMYLCIYVLADPTTYSLCSTYSMSSNPDCPGTIASIHLPSAICHLPRQRVPSAPFHRPKWPLHRTRPTACRHCAPRPGTPHSGACMRQPVTSRRNT